MTIEQAIDVRRSCRKYLPVAIEESIVSKLRMLIMAYNEKSGLDMQLILNNGDAFNGISKSYGMFSGVMNYIALVGNENDSLLKEKIGYYGELLVLEATALGLGTCWVAGTFSRNDCLCKLIEGNQLVCVITIGNVPDSMSMKEKLIHNLMHRKTKTAKEMFEADLNPPDWFEKGMVCVQKAPSGSNRQPVVFSYKKDIVSAAADNSNAIDLGIAKLHFELGAGGGKWNWGNGAAFIHS